MVQENASAPDFSLNDQDGKAVRLSDYRGKTVVLYFYPKDDTPGCTKEACSLKEGYGAIGAKGAVILGVSPDGSESHGKFRSKYGLPFTLLSDPDHRVMEEWGVWGEKHLYGKKSMGVLRTTFIIAPDGTVKKVIRAVDTDKHAEQVLPWL